MNLHLLEGGAERREDHHVPRLDLRKVLFSKTGLCDPS